MNQLEIEANTSNKRQARENAYEQVTIGFGLTSHWSRKCSELFYPIRERSKAKPKPTQHYFPHSFDNCSKVVDFRTASWTDSIKSLIPHFLQSHIKKTHCANQTD